ncbi:hypothetical protein D3C72_1273140 [compost metagenome]
MDSVAGNTKSVWVKLSLPVAKLMDLRVLALAAPCLQQLPLPVAPAWVFTAPSS